VISTVDPESDSPGGSVAAVVVTDNMPPLGLRTIVTVEPLARLVTAVVSLDAEPDEARDDADEAVDNAASDAAALAVVADPAKMGEIPLMALILMTLPPGK
jgi:hypothetical protein